MRRQIVNVKLSSILTHHSLRITAAMQTYVREHTSGERALQWSCMFRMIIKLVMSVPQRFKSGA